MTVYQSTASFIKKHRRKIIIGSTITLAVGGIAAVGYYKWSQHQNQLEEQRKTMSNRMRFLYEENRKTVEIALRSLLPKINEKLQKEEPVEDMLHELKTKKDLNADDKKQIWEELKLSSFTRALTAVYSISLLHLFLSVQVNIIGRHLFLKHQFEKQKQERMQKKNSSAFWDYVPTWLGNFSSTQLQAQQQQQRQLKEEDILNLTENVQQLFLCTVAHFQEEGLDQLLKVVENTVKSHISELSLKQLFTPNDMFHLIEAMRSDIEVQFEQNGSSGISLQSNNENDTRSGEEKISFSMSSIMLPPEKNDLEQLPENATPQEKEVLKSLLDELRDILESDDYLNVFKEASTDAFSVLHKHLEAIMMTSHQQQQMKKSNQQILSDSTQQMMEENVVRIHLANVIPHLTKELKKIMDNSEENEYVWSVHGNILLNKYCVIVYSTDIST